MLGRVAIEKTNDESSSSGSDATRAIVAVSVSWLAETDLFSARGGSLSVLLTFIDIVAGSLISTSVSVLELIPLSVTLKVNESDPEKLGFGV